MTHGDDLNPAQRQAVEHVEGPLLVLAGPGSGKTRVITRRIAHLVERGVDPREILAITFTNKAAREMADRVARLLPGSRVWVSTFHSLCARLLRKYAPAVGLNRNYSIFDTADQRQLLRQVYASLDIDAHTYNPGTVAQRISEAKGELLSAEQFSAAVADNVGDYFNRTVARVYLEYQRLLLESNGVDFDDLLSHICRLVRECDDIRADLDRRFQFILVDEYQDTNAAQYGIVRALSQDFPNLCATGDPDQSIYRWRGADVRNILHFERDFPTTAVVRLEQNYRSTKSILRAADRLIEHNRKRKPKSLFTENAEGDAPTVLCFGNQTEEARGLADMIRDLARREQRPWSDFAIVYRTNALSRGLEAALTASGVPYQVAGGVAFYDRAEIKDLLAYLRLIHNPADQAAFQRVVNTPPRGVGARSQQRLAAFARQESLTVLEAAAQAAKIKGLPKRAAAGLRQLTTQLDDLSRTPFTGVKDLLSRILDRTHYREGVALSGSEDDAQRLANVEELLTAAGQYDEESAGDASLEQFLESVGLASEVDNLDPAAGRVSLLTLHAAKGLEFPVVFVLAVEQNLLPHERALKTHEADEVEEERRLLFVGMTRARDRLFLTQTVERDFRGRSMRTITSQFLDELHPTLEWKSLRNGEWESVTARELVGTFNPRGGEDPAIVAHRERLRQLLGNPDRPLITSGAALLAGQSNSSRAFAPGSLVRHPRYGVGTILQSSGSDHRLTVVVQFEDGEPSHFIVGKSPLQPVGLS